MSAVQKALVSPMLARSEKDAEGWDACPQLSKHQAEMLLDWLEANGFSQREVRFEETGGFTVRWRK